MTCRSASFSAFERQSFYVALHRYFCWHPVIGASIEIVLPCPFVFQGHQLVYIHLPAVEHSLVFRVDALAQVIRPASGATTQRGRYVSIIRLNGRMNTVLLRVILMDCVVLYICVTFQRLRLQI